MRILGMLATLVVFAVGFWAKTKYAQIEAQVHGTTNNGGQVVAPESAAEEGSTAYALIDSVMNWFTSTGDGTTINPYTGNETRAIDYGNVETNQFVDESSP